jgi:hypothetical protein
MAKTKKKKGRSLELDKKVTRKGKSLGFARDKARKG